MGIDEDMRAASSTMRTKREQGKEEEADLRPKREDMRKETDKEISKGKDPKVPVRQESQINWSALISRRTNVKK